MTATLCVIAAVLWLKIDATPRVGQAEVYQSRDLPS